MSRLCMLWPEKHWAEGPSPSARCEPSLPAYGRSSGPSAPSSTARDVIALRSPMHGGSPLSYSLGPGALQQGPGPCNPRAPQALTPMARERHKPAMRLDSSGQPSVFAARGSRTQPMSPRTGQGHLVCPEETDRTILAGAGGAAVEAGG